MDQVSIIKQMVQSLSEEEKTELLDFLNGKSIQSPKQFGDFKSLVIQHKSASLPDRPVCPHCGSIRVYKNGHKEGKQRYLCRDCSKTFAITNNTILYRSQKSIEIWEKYFECLMNKFSLRKCAEICNIDVTTAFYWRHKILDVLQELQKQVTINGVAEADEAYFPLSFKGDHTKSNFKMPRVAHKRGKSITTRGLSQEQVCVPCTVNLNGLSIGKISNLGKPNVHNLSAVLNHRIEKGSILVTDSLRSYHKIAFDNELTHVRIPKGRHTNGSFNIQTINAYHSELKRLVHGNFKGVATKYLNNYVVYHNFVNFAKGKFNEKFDILREFIYITDADIRSKEISKREAIPVINKVA